MKIALLLLLTTLMNEISTPPQKLIFESLSETQPTDSLGPIISLEISFNHIQLYRIKSDSLATETRAVFLKGSLLSVNALTQQSGNVSIYTTFNEAREQLYRDPIKLIAKGRHSVKIRAVDTSGNESSLTFNYLIIE
jgi:hypothetical protein